MWNDALPRNGITNWSVFYGQAGGSSGGWQSWTKPAGCSWIYIYLLAAGGGGGSSTTGVNVGSGGGGSGGITRLLVPATFVPDIIYVRPGLGGPAVSSANGTNGLASYISIAPNITAQNLILSQGGGGGGGGGGTTTAGAAGAAATSGSGIWMNIGLFTSIAGQAGGAGGANSNGSDVTFGASGIPTTGGAGGGGGLNFNGGSIIGAGLVPTIPGALFSTIAPAADGFRIGQPISFGFKSFPQLLFTGGAGGSSYTNGANAGGNASYGCGGGGGSPRSGSGFASNGGRGGDALILIGAF